MSIQFLPDVQQFVLSTSKTRYIMEIVSNRYLMHRYYGDSENIPELPYRFPGLSFSPFPADLGVGFSLNRNMQEFPGFDTGDYREDAIRIRNANGDCATQFTYESHRIFKGRREIKGLPFASVGVSTETLEIQLRDTVTDCLVHLFYTVYPDTDVISRYYILENKSNAPVVLEKGMSLSLDIPDSHFKCLLLHGSHVNERNLESVPLPHAKLVLDSRRGATGHALNSFFALTAEDATEESGETYGFHFVYSGDFCNTIEVDQHGITRIQVGLNPDRFRWRLAPGEAFFSPEALMSYTTEGIGQISRNYHRFARRYILRPCPWEHHPIVLNSWEGTFFDINEKLILDYAKNAAACGADMLVMDDGWFGKRYNDRAALGDWFPNPERFPDGLAACVRRIKEYPLRFGIWIEPEMVNPDSDLFRSHPDWVLQCKGRACSLGRNQLVLDFSNHEVIKYLKDVFSKAFEGVSLDYIKWDFNRNLTEVGSPALPPEAQMEVPHRYMLGLYELFQWFVDTYPNVMIENCSGGGGRFDFGMLKYSSQIWTSDNTSPERRTFIQYGTSLGYPAACMSCHVTNHSNAVEVPRSLFFRYAVAAQGVFGYEFDFSSVSETARETIRNQIAEYRTYAHLVEEGDLYRLLNPFECGISAFYYVNDARTEFLLSFLQPKAQTPREYRLVLAQAEPEATYTDRKSGEKYSGKQLLGGVAVSSDSADEFAKMFYFVKDAK